MTEKTITDRIGSTAGHFFGKLAVSQAIIGSLGGAAAGIGLDNIFGPVGIGAAAAAGVMINQAGYQHRRAELREMYRDEAAAKLGKSPQKINDKDIETLAKGDSKRGIEGNKTIAEELQQLKKRRNLGMLVSAVSILGTLAIVALATTTGVGEVLGAGQLIARAVSGIAVHAILEKPLHWLGKKLLGIEDSTTHEQIATLSREHRNGKVISPDRVLGIFVGANTELKKFVEDQYSKAYDKLSVPEKKALVEAVGQYMPIHKITDDLNSGSVKISELSFAVEGQKSGVAPNSTPQHLSMVGKVRSALRNIGERRHHAPNDKSVGEPAPSPLSVAPSRAIVEYDNPLPTRSFVERYKAEKNHTTGRTIH